MKTVSIDHGIYQFTRIGCETVKIVNTVTGKIIK